MPGLLQRQVQATIDELVAAGGEIGLQVAVTHAGRTVVDAAAGTADQRTGEPVTPATLFFAASTGKGIASSVVHVLAERGELAYDQRVADVWWRPRTMTGYHPLTFGFIVGELVRRATGRTLAEVLRTRLAGPLGVAGELHFGVPGHLLARVARAGPDGAAPPLPEPGSPLDRAIPAGVQPTAAFANHADVLLADIPSQGTMSARAAARLYAALLGYADGVNLVSPERPRTKAAPAFSGVDQVMGFPSEWAFGFSAAAAIDDLVAGHYR